MQTMIYGSVPNVERMTKACSFGIKRFNLCGKGCRINLRKSWLRLYGSAHEKLRGNCLVSSVTATVSIYTGSHATEEDILLTIFHELAHAKFGYETHMCHIPGTQFYHELKIEKDADDQAIAALKDFLEFELE